MATEILKSLGFNVNTKLSNIIIHEGTDTKVYDDISSGIYTDAYIFLNKKIQTFKKIIAKKTSLNELENLFSLGYKYGLSKIDLSAQQIWNEICENKRNQIYLNKIFGDFELSKNDQKIKLSLIETVSGFYTQIAYGFSLSRYLPMLELFYVAIKKNRGYFESITKDEIFNSTDFKKDIEILTILNQLGHKHDTTIKDLVENSNRIDALKKEFNQIVTPDKVKTIQDRIERLNKMIKESPKDGFGHLNNLYENLYRQGYLFALRDENPLLLKILKNNYSYVEYDSWSFLNPEKERFSKDKVHNSTIIFEMIIEGYAYSYHLSFLEGQLNKLGFTNSPEITTTTSTETLKLVKLKWGGQKNQLYHVLRELKSQNHITNSYEELAVFIKANVDIFNNTSLSTIQKELGKNKKLPRNKRISI